MEYCSPCERYFPSRVALQQHQQTSGRHTYDCSRCQKHFGSYFAQRQHVRNSPRHHVCTDCTQGQDFNSEYELDQHAATYHNLCRTCDRSFDTPEQVVQHDIAQHYMCLTCRHYFQSSSNLKNVSSPQASLMAAMFNVFVASQNPCGKNHALLRMH